MVHELASLSTRVREVRQEGREVAARVRAFDAEVVCFSRSRSPVGDYVYLPLDELLSSSDIVSLHVPLSPATRGMIGARELALMKPDAVLINTSRGPVVDQPALLAALQARRLAGAGLDVLDPEPPDPSDPLLQLPNVVFTPHNAGQAEEVWPRIVRTCFANIERVAHGEPPLFPAKPLD